MKLEKVTKNFLWPAACFVAALMVLVCCGTARGGDWPNWRGPNYNGISDETDWNTEWPEGGPKVLWKASIGIGFSSVAVSDGLAYAMGNANKADTVYCFDAETGEEKWTHSYAQRRDPKYYEGGTLASPTVAGGKVYTISKDGKVFCLDAKTGSVKWQKDISKELEIKRTTWGHSGSPLVIGEIVILNAGPKGLALKTTDGSVVWQSGKKPGGYATAVPYMAGGQQCIALFSFGEVIGIVAATGEELWRHTAWKNKYNVNAADPIISGDMIFISSGYDHGCALLKMQVDGQKHSVTKVWTNKNIRNKMNGSVLWQGYIYGVDEEGELRCLDFKTGDIVWAQEGFGQGSLSLADGKLLVLGEKGNLEIAEATPAGFNRLAAAKILTGRCWTVPVLANGRIYTRNAKPGDLVCLDVKGKGGAAGAKASSAGNDWAQFRGPNRNGISNETGLLKKWPAGGPEMLWDVDGLGTGFASVAVSDGMIYTTGLVGKDGLLFAYDLAGNLKWKVPYGPGWTGSHRGVRTTPTVEADRLYLRSGYGNVVCFNSKTGEKNWEVDTLKTFGGKNIHWGIAESLLIDGNKLICTPGGNDAVLAALDKMTGEVIWTTKGLGERSAYCCPVIIEEDGKKLIATMVEKSIIIVDAADGRLLCQIPQQGKHSISAVSPVYKDGIIYGTNGYGGGGKAYKLSGDMSSFEKIWEDKNLDCHHGGVVFLDGNIHGSNHKPAGSKGWVCLEMATGKVKYQDKVVGKGSVIYADGMLYCYSEKGTVGLVKAKPNGYELVSSFQVEKGTDEHWAHPAISDGRLYIRHGDALMAYNIKAQ